MRCKLFLIFAATLAVLMGALKAGRCGTGDLPVSGKRSNAPFDSDRVIAECTDALRRDPNDLRAYSRCARAWYDKGRYSKTVADYNEVLRLDPGCSLAYYGRACAWYAKYEFDKAIEDFSDRLRFDPDDASAYYWRGRAWYERHERGKAVQDFSDCLRLAPDDSHTYDARGFVWLEEGQYDKAVADLSNALRLNPESIAAHNNLAWIQATCPEKKHRDGRRAVTLATQACELTDWKNASTLNTLAAAYAESGEYAEVIEWHGRALDLYSPADRAKWMPVLALYKSSKPYRHKPEVTPTAKAEKKDR
jgi:tetratricopeptide (TPR) repeat protein